VQSQQGFCHDHERHVTTSLATLARILREWQSEASPRPAALPRITKATDWERGLRASVRSSLGSGWTLREDRGKARLEARTEATKGSVTLPFDWSRSNVGDILARTRNIFALVADGYELRDAALIANNSHRTEKIQWEAAATAFRTRLLSSGNRIKEKTYREDYSAYIDHAVALLGSNKPPRNGGELAERTAEKWRDKPRAIEKCCIAIKRFLEYATEHHGAPPKSWLLSRERLKEVRGRPSRKKSLAHLEEEEILRLYEENRKGRNGIEWANYVALLTTYRLRREEPWHCVPREHPTKGWQMYCTYEKVSGNDRTKPRWLRALPPEGSSEYWGDLVEAMRKGQLQLPNTSPQAWNNRLARMIYWQHLNEKYEINMGQSLKPGALRDTYSFRAHKRGLRLNTICLAMGHSITTHQQHYVWASEETPYDD
jgi:hypothetical protein